MPVFKRKVLLGFSLAIACAAPILAQRELQPMQKPGAPDRSRVSGGVYKVDHEHTMVRWEVDHLGVTPYFGTFGQITGSLILDPRRPDQAKVDIIIPVAQVITASSGLTAHLLKAPEKVGGKPDFFGSSPADARFISTAVVRGSGPNDASITGNLTLNGITRPVTLAATFYGAAKMPQQMGGQEMIGFKAEASIKRSDFGISMGIPMVSDEVELDIVAAFVK